MVCVLKKQLYLYNSFTLCSCKHVTAKRYYLLPFNSNQLKLKLIKPCSILLKNKREKYINYQIRLDVNS